MTRRAAGLTSVVVTALVATVLVGSQVLASTGATTPRPEPLVPAASSNAPDDEGDKDDGDGDGDGGNAHSRAVHAWVACKAVKGKEACVKPASPGKALGHGHGWGRAHAPGQLKTKDKGDDERHSDEPTS